MARSRSEASVIDAESIPDANWRQPNDDGDDDDDDDDDYDDDDDDDDNDGD